MSVPDVDGALAAIHRALLLREAAASVALEHVRTICLDDLDEGNRDA